MFSLKTGSALIALLFVFNIIVWIRVLNENDQVLRVSFLDIGQGDAVFIEAPNGNQMLVDGGSGKQVLRSLGSVMPFYDRSIDVVLSTHPDTDHIGGLPDVFRSFSVASFVHPDIDSDNSSFEELNRAVEEEKSQIFIANSGDKIFLSSEIYFEIFSPTFLNSNIEPNSGSIVGKLVYGDTEVLLTGDAPSGVEEYLVVDKKLNLESDVLKAGHHGSDTSTSKIFLESVRPEFVVISAGEDNRYGHPHKEVIDRLEEIGSHIFYTWNGEVIFESDGLNWSVRQN